jgi:prevent-host-death family protein
MGQKMDTTIAAGQFKAKCLQLLDDVAESRTELTITKHGKPVAKLVPLPSGKPLFGAMHGSVLKAEDLVTPLDEPWNADQ